MQWPDVDEGASYIVEKSGDSGMREGEIGTVVKTRQSGFGHKWAVMRFADGTTVSMRTHLLTRVQPTEGAT
jgi:hypothetical protein